MDSPYTHSSDNLFRSSNNLRDEFDTYRKKPPTAKLYGGTKKCKVKKLSIEESWISQEKVKDLYVKYFTLEECPPSLKLIVRFYRAFLFSFSGLVFPSSSESSLLNSFIRSLFFITLNILALGPYIWAFIEGQNSGNSVLGNSTKKMSNESIQALKLELNFKKVFIETGKDEDWHTLKPILRYIIEGLRVGFFFNGFISFALNLLLGSRILRQILLIPSISTIDNSTWRGVKLLLGVLISITGIFTIGLIMFNRGTFVTLACLVFKAESVKPEDNVLMVKTLFVSGLYYINFIILTMGTVLFCYVMGLFDENIKMIIDGLKNVHLDELTLYKIKNDCATLNGHFKSVISRSFTIPLTIDMIINTLLLIAASCFLMINQGKERYYLTSVFGLGAFALARLIIVCVAGNAVSNNFRELIREIYEQVPEWDLGTWMCFLEIKQMQEQFEVTVSGGVYTVRQSAILTVLGFCLNYIVVLLQTENYGSEGASTG